MAVIELESPFKEIWRKGYLVTNKEPRRNVILFNSKSDRSTISYARYLMSVKLGRFLNKDEYVDHINGDKLDDRVENYQIVSCKDNNIKSKIQTKSSEMYVKLSCGVCGNIFEKPRNKTHLIIPKKSTYCSRHCGGKSLTVGVSSTILEVYRKDKEFEGVVEIL